MSGARPGAPDPPLVTRQSDLIIRLAFVGLAAAGFLTAVRVPRVGGAIAVVGALVVGALMAFEAHAGIAFAAGAGLLTAALVLVMHPWAGRTSIVTGTILAAFAAGVGAVTWHGYGFVYGATHPQSTVPGPPNGAVDWVWSGGVTSSAAVVTARVSTTGRRIDLSTTPRARVTQRRTGGVVRFELAGLPAGTKVAYRVTVDGRDDGSGGGAFRTLPRGPASFEVAFSSCARTGSNGAVFDAIRTRDPLLYLNLGDLYYANIERNDPPAFRRAFNRVLTRPAQANLYRSIATAYVWDDHDFGPNDSDGRSASAPAAHQVYREVVPHHRLGLAGATAPLAQAFTVGRVRFVVTDTRSGRSPANAPDGRSKSMLGIAQRRWFEHELVAARDGGLLVVWVSPVSWIGPADGGSDGWSAFAHERREIADFIVRERIDALVMLSGDTHALAIDDGLRGGYSSSGAPGFPIAHGGALDRQPQSKGGDYSEGVSAGGGRFGTLSIDDQGGDEIAVRLSGWNWRGERLLSHRTTFTLPRAGASAELAR